MKLAFSSTNGLLAPCGPFSSFFHKLGSLKIVTYENEHVRSHTQKRHRDDAYLKVLDQDRGRVSIRKSQTLKKLPKTVAPITNNIGVEAEANAHKLRKTCRVRVHVLSVEPSFTRKALHRPEHVLQSECGSFVRWRVDIPLLPYQIKAIVREHHERLS